VTFAKGNNGVALVENEEDIRESLIILLTTIAGERILRPDYGAGLENMVFEPLSVTTSTMISNQMKRSILFHEPRVKVENINLESDNFNGFITITIEFTIISTNRRSNLVFPYYLNEGTNLEQ
jgi:phage baseplate assembly protein W